MLNHNPVDNIKNMTSAFILDEFVNHNGKFTTKMGNPISFCCFCNNTPGKMLVKVTSYVSGKDEITRYANDGNRYAGYEDMYSIVKVA